MGGWLKNLHLRGVVFASVLISACVLTVPGWAQLVPKDGASQYWDGSRLITQGFGDDAIKIQSPVQGESRVVKIDGLFRRPLDFHEGRFWGLKSVDLPDGRVRLDLYSSTDAVHWSAELAIQKQIPEGRVYRILPVRGDTFLLVSSKTFIQGEATSPFALAKRDGKGGLKITGLLDLGLKYPWFIRANGTGFVVPSVPGWEFNPKLGRMIFGVGSNFIRTPNAILLPDMATGWMWILKTDTENPRLTCARLFGSMKDDMLADSWNREWAILGIQPRPDGHFLIASRTLEAVLHSREEEKHLKPITTPKGEPPDAQQAREIAQDREVLRFPKIEWWDLDPANGAIKPEPTPPGAPFELRMAGMVRAFRFHYEPIEQVVVE